MKAALLPIAKPNKWGALVFCAVLVVCGASAHADPIRRFDGEEIDKNFREFGLEVVRGYQITAPAFISIDIYNSAQEKWESFSQSVERKKKELNQFLGIGVNAGENDRDQQSSQAARPINTGNESGLYTTASTSSNPPPKNSPRESTEEMRRQCQLMVPGSREQALCDLKVFQIEDSHIVNPRERILSGNSVTKETDMAKHDNRPEAARENQQLPLLQDVPQSTLFSENNPRNGGPPPTTAPVQQPDVQAAVANDPFAEAMEKTPQQLDAERQALAARTRAATSRAAASSSSADMATAVEIFSAFVGAAAAARSNRAYNRAPGPASGVNRGGGGGSMGVGCADPGYKFINGMCIKPCGPNDMKYWNGMQMCY